MKVKDKMGAPNEGDYNSDSDESDEDFQPDNATGESDVSDDFSDDYVDAKNTTDEDDADRQEHTKDIQKRKGKRKGNRCKKSSKSVKKLKEGEHKEVEIKEQRRTRHSIANNSSGRKQTCEKDEIEAGDMDKCRTETLWADFLNDVKPDLKQSEHSESNKVNNCAKSETEQSNKHEINMKSPTNNKTIIEVAEFAGEEVHLQNDIVCQPNISDDPAISDKPAKTLETNLSHIGKSTGIGMKRSMPSSIRSPRTGPAGLGCILNQIGKKKKLSVLEKTQIDWNSFKKNEGIEEQLQTFNKGKDGYLERQDFLERTDLRQFEIEKNLRQSRCHL